MQYYDDWCTHYYDDLQTRVHCDDVCLRAINGIGFGSNDTRVDTVRSTSSDIHTKLRSDVNENCKLRKTKLIVNAIAEH